MCFRRRNSAPEIEVDFNDTWKTEAEINALSGKFIALLTSNKDCPIDELADIVNELKRITAYSGTTFNKVLEYADKKENYSSGFMV